MSRIVLYEDDHLRGESLELRTGVADLAKEGFGDKISSVLVVEGTWVMYRDDTYQGESWIVKATGGLYDRGVYLQPSDWGGRHDNISSLRPV